MSVREKGKGKGKESGGKEGSGGGDGEGDGGQATKLGGEGKGFSFGPGVKPLRNGGGSTKGGSASMPNGAPSLSYRDKLLSPGCAGFLVKHSEEDDIVKGWRDYFHKMNEEESQGDREESDEEDIPMKTNSDGKPGKLRFSAEEYTAWCLPWMNSLIIKVLGANFPTYVIRDRINRMWRPKDALKLIPLSNGYYVVSFSNKEDREYAFQEGPWMIEDHYLIVQRWRPNFNPWKADQCVVAAWVRLPDVPFEFYNVESLRRIGNMIGKMIKVDRSTSIYDKGGFARICVEIDLKKPLLPTYLVFGEERAIVYEGLHNVCFSCGKYGHLKVACPTNKPQSSTQVPEQDNIDKERGGNGEIRQENTDRMEAVNTKGLEKDVNVGVTGGRQPENSAGDIGGAFVVSGEVDSDDSPYGKIKVLRRDFRGSLNGQLRSDGLRKGDHESKKMADIRGSNESIQILRRNSGKNDTLTDVSLIKTDLVKDKILPKSEWVPVGSKRKNENKGRIKGKENKNPSKSKAGRVSLVGHGLGPSNSNSFKVLQEVSAQVGVGVGLSNESPMAETDVGHVSNCLDASMSSPGDHLAVKPMVLGSCVVEADVQGINSVQHILLDESIGTGAKSFPALVRDLKSHYHLNFIAIVETRCAKEASVGRASQLGFPNMELIDCEGYSGGIWCLWDHNIASISVLERHHQFIHLQVNGSAGCSWMLTVYKLIKTSHIKARPDNLVQTINHDVYSKLYQANFLLTAGNSTPCAAIITNALLESLISEGEGETVKELCSSRV
ncbi:hypothetical protein K1719_013898 [Acacia pycnantha]|nr:hypothetical protein K1719_013898 [Acacia pycnantha]